MWYQNIRSMFFRFVTKHACDRQTDGQNYDPQDRASIAASHGKNVKFQHGWTNRHSHAVTAVTESMGTPIRQVLALAFVPPSATP